MKILVLAIVLVTSSFAQANQQEAGQLATQIKAAIDGGQLNFIDNNSREQVLFHLRASNRILGGGGPVVETTYGCVSTGNGNYGFFNMTTGKQIGSNYGSLLNCQGSIPKPGVRYACLSTGNGNYGFFDLQVPIQVGMNYGGMQNCAASLPAPNARFACISTGNGNYGLFNLGSRLQIGQDFGSMQNCQGSLPK